LLGGVEDWSDREDESDFFAGERMRREARLETLEDEDEGVGDGLSLSGLSVD
jgi:hypothetical protein